jgi:acylglycerol lipase
VQHLTHSFRTSDGLMLFTQCWLPQEPKAIVVLSHGYAEHAGRYARVAEYLVRHDYAVYALDHRGHGRSEGERANITVFRAYINDLKDYLEKIRQQHPTLRRFLLGHSVGGLIALQTVLEHAEKVDGVVLTGAYLKDATGTPGYLVALSKVVGTLFPRLDIQALNANDLSRDPEVVQAYRQDPLVYHGKVKARMGAEMLAAGPYVLDHAQSIDLPVLLMHGGEDRIADPEGARTLYACIGSKDKALKIYDGLYHEILNEPEKQQVLDDIVRWLDRRLGKTSG